MTFIGLAGSSPASDTIELPRPRKGPFSCRRCVEVAGDLAGQWRAGAPHGGGCVVDGGLDTTGRSDLFDALVGMIDEAVLVFDEEGVVCAANYAASKSFNLGCALRGLTQFSGPDVRDLFYTIDLTRCDDTVLPFTTDGVVSRVMAKMFDDSFVPMLAKCELLPEHGRYILVAYTNLREEGREEQARLREELKHLNERLHGTLSIISCASLGTGSFEELTVRVANELQRVMSASAAVLYLADDYGFTPYGVSEDFGSLGVERAYLPMGVGVPTLVTRNRRTTRLQLVSPSVTPESGAIMLDLDAETRFRLRSMLAECCSTIVGTPVFSYDRIVAVLVVGWMVPHQVSPDDVQLLDTVADYLSVEFAAAATQIEQARASSLTSTMNEIRDMVRDECDMSDDLVERIAERVSTVVPSHVMVLESNAYSNTTLVHLRTEARSGVLETLEFPHAIADVFPNGADCVAIEPTSPCGLWIGRHTDLATGFGVMLVPGPMGSRSGCVALLVMRSAQDRPFDIVEQAFLRNVAREVGSTLHVEQERAHDAEISKALQVGLRNELPEARGVTTASLYISATESAVVGGDFFDLYELPDDRIVVVMGDVSGKGVEAAAMASLVKTALAAYAWNFLDPASMLGSLNNLFLNFSRLETFASMVVVSVDFRSGEATYCSAGHPPAMIVHGPHEPAAELELLTVQSPIVGAFENMHYDNGMFTFEPGDILYMYTDGTTEARSPSGEFFGEDALRETLLRVCRLGIEEVPRGVLGEVEAFAGGSLHDDIAMVALRFDGIDHRESLANGWDSFEGMSFDEGMDEVFAGLHFEGDAPA